MRRYEFVEGSSKKFWEIELEGSSFTARWGRVGTEGQEKTQDFDTPAEARAAHDKLVKEKEKKGYQLVSGDGGDARPLSAKLPENPELEAKLAANRDDVQAWSVYADWLIEKGEPWGEVIAQACVGKPDAQKQEGAFGEGTDFEGVSTTWKHGVLEELDFSPPEPEDDYEGGLAQILRHPAGKLARKLTLGLPPSEDTEWSLELPVEVLGKNGPFPLLEELDMSQTAEHMDQVSWRRVGDIRGLWKAAPRLKTLLLEGSSGSDGGVAIKLAPITAPVLEKLVIQSGGLDEAAPTEIGAANLPKLTHLELWFGQEDYGNNSSVESLAGILAGKGLPSLKTLAIKNSGWEGELIEAVATSAVLPRLEVLDFSMGVMCREAAQALREHADRFKHLKQLVLDDNYIQDEDAQQLQKVLPNVVIGAQKELDGDLDDPYSRYVSVSE